MINKIEVSAEDEYFSEAAEVSMHSATIPQLIYYVR
jgi:hypothetical protein